MQLDKLKIKLNKYPKIKCTIKLILCSGPFQVLRELKTKCMLDTHQRKFIKHNQAIWKTGGTAEPCGEILVDIFNVPEAMYTYSYFCNALAKKSNAKLKNYIWEYNIVPPDASLLHKSFNITETVRILLNRRQKKELEKLYKSITGEIQTKEDLLNLVVGECSIGIDIYESYLREYNQPTVYFNDDNLFRILKIGLSIYLFWRDYFIEQNVKGLVVSHDNYIWMNIPCKVAYLNVVPVYLPSARGIVYATEPFSAYKCLKNYPEIFRKLTNEKQDEAIALSKRQLEERFSGKVGVDMHYATASAYGDLSSKRILDENDKIKVLIATHCFYDNPHAYDKIPFVDFYEWLVFLGELSEETNYDWYIKLHPDPLPGTEDIIINLIDKYKKIKLIDYRASHHQLIEEGIDFVLTCYGTIGEEYPYYGKQVINAAYNPRISYDFNWHAKGLDDYRRLVLNLESLELKIDKKQLYEFYYMNHYHNWVDDFIFKSYRKFLEKYSGDRGMSSEVFTYILNEFDRASHENRLNKIEKYIDSGERYFFTQESV